VRIPPRKRIDVTAKQRALELLDSIIINGFGSAPGNESSIVQLRDLVDESQNEETADGSLGAEDWNLLSNAARHLSEAERLARLVVFRFGKG